MIVKEICGTSDKTIEAYSDEMEFIVCAANMAGYMEHAEQIYIDDDSTLSVFCIELVEKYYEETDIDISFQEFAQARLIQKFGIGNSNS